MRDRLKVFGIDIIKGSVRSRSRRPMYALVRMDGPVSRGNLKCRSSGSSVCLPMSSRIFSRLTACRRLPPTSTSLFLSAGPAHADPLVQVTGGERKETLGKVAGPVQYQFQPVRSVCRSEDDCTGRIAGAGAEVIAFENESEVVVSRHRSPGKGGWSQNRYVRKMHGAVQLKGREIEQALVAAGLRYEKKETRAFGGCSRVAFRVFAPGDQVPVSTYRGADVQVRISGKRLERIQFRPLSGKPRYMIVGIDPGTTTAFAALDLDGNLLHLQCSRQMTMSDMIEALYKVGKPLVIASDVEDMPFTVEKIRGPFLRLHIRQNRI